jgi:hypothetical protein
VKTFRMDSRLEASRCLTPLPDRRTSLGISNRSRRKQRAGRRETPDSTVRGSLQPCPAAQRDRVRDSERHAHGSAGRDPRGARPEAGKGSPAAPTETEPGRLGRLECVWPLKRCLTRHLAQGLGPVKAERSFPMEPHWVCGGGLRCLTNGSLLGLKSPPDVVGPLPSQSVGLPALWLPKPHDLHHVR